MDDTTTETPTKPSGRRHPGDEPPTPPRFEGAGAQQWAAGEIRPLVKALTFEGFKVFSAGATAGWTDDGSYYERPSFPLAGHHPRVTVDVRLAPDHPDRPCDKATATEIAERIREAVLAQAARTLVSAGACLVVRVMMLGGPKTDSATVELVA